MKTVEAASRRLPPTVANRVFGKETLNSIIDVLNGGMVA
jgi:hypothetical protein